ncbi:tRNA (uridine(54)-C5)-methyltransferase TrmA [Uliginosibacterium sp. 31-16]|uniref:tRNA (uridine(54)-C5)-methyltransferase TrmA n=1 Tax=Uliginosibacterium sp. 31-16 TaxID=3068315 RepID=UPI00273D7135|nr:tRNA (uridine(54)-C5)-methyltransferase TrmA [Uliginosibacterium sp. 31-16]MDP5238014.1 tRNA (uridine(54)-C5)-methyltransferase TrmA [Uliginosibacterium sp. 31-16]
MSQFQIDPATYETQLAEKLARFTSDFAAHALPEPAVFRSAALHYRQRAEFRIWHAGADLHYAMFDPAAPKTPVLMDAFPAAAESICTLMPRLKDALQVSEELRRKLFQVNFLATRSGQMLVTLIYHRKLEDAWEAAARELAAAFGIKLIGRSLKQKIVLDTDWLLEELEVGTRRLRYQQIEGSFTQPNAGVNQQMLGWACMQAENLGGDLLELYCGNGNFTVALAPHFGRVLATEMSKPSVKAAHYNLEANGIGNVAMVRMASDEISDALARVRPFTRLKDIDLDSYRFSTLFVDPPRSGLDAPTIELARGFERILYISCNPQTLRENVAALADTHVISASAVFDQFPYTHHLECGLLLTRKPAAA